MGIICRCAPLLQLVIYMLQVYLLSSRTFLSQQLQNTPVVTATPPHSLVGGTGGGGGNNTSPQALEEEREKLRGALVLTQESAAVQILLEACLMRKQHKVSRITLQTFKIPVPHSVVGSISTYCDIP